MTAEVPFALYSQTPSESLLFFNVCVDPLLLDAVFLVSEIAAYPRSKIIVNDVDRP